MIVVDNTVLIHFALPTSAAEDTARARGVLARDSDWRVPPFWASEFRHVAMKYVRPGRLELEDAVLSALSLTPIVTVEPVHHAEVLHTAYALGLSGYDAEYAALAVRLGVPLVTTDRRLREAVPGAVTPASAAGG